MTEQYSDTQARFFYDDSWFLEDEEISVVTYCYMPTNSDLDDEFIGYHIDVMDCRVSFIKGSVDYKELSMLKENSEFSKSPIINCIAEEKTIKNQHFMMVSTKYSSSLGPYAEGFARKKIDAAEGLITISFGKNYVYRTVFKCITHFTNNKTDFFSGSIENPATEPRYNPAIDGILLREISSGIERLDEQTKNRLLLCFYWIKEALNDQNTTTAFLRLWIALEVLAMPNTSDIKNIKDILCDIYNIEAKDKENKLHIGKLQRLRSAIVHDGINNPVSGHLVGYLRDIIFDVFCHVVRLPKSNRVGAWLNSPTPDIRALIAEAIKP